MAKQTHHARITWIHCLKYYEMAIGADRWAETAIRAEHGAHVGAGPASRSRLQIAHVNIPKRTVDAWHQIGGGAYKRNKSPVRCDISQFRIAIASACPGGIDADQIGNVRPNVSRKDVARLVRILHRDQIRREALKNNPAAISGNARIGGK